MGDLDVSVDPLLVPTEQDTTTRSSTSGGHVMSKASGEAIRAEHEANVAQAKAQEAVGDAEALATSRRTDDLYNQRDELRAQAADQAAQHQDYLDRIDRARNAAANAEEKFANHKFEDYWSHQSVGKRIASAFGLFLGGTAASVNGGRNIAAEALQRDVDRDFDRQKADLDQQREVARQKGADVNGLFAQEGYENAALAIKHAKANEATAAAMLASQVEAGIPVEQAKNNVLASGLYTRAEEKRREALQHYDRTFSGTTSNKDVIGTPKGNAALGLRERNQLKLDQERWFKENRGPQIAEANRGLKGIEEKLFDEHGNVRKDVDPATQQMIVMELDKASKGGTATGASMGAVLSHLGGTGDKFATLLEKAGTGGLGRGALNIIGRGVTAARNANKSEASQLQRSYSQTYYQAPELQHLHDDLVTGETKYLNQFGYAQRPGAAPAAAAAPAQPGTAVTPAAAPSQNLKFKRLQSGETGWLASDGKFFPAPPGSPQPGAQ